MLDCFLLRPHCSVYVAVLLLWRLLATTPEVWLSVFRHPGRMLCGAYLSLPPQDGCFCFCVCHPSTPRSFVAATCRGERKNTAAATKLIRTIRAIAILRYTLRVPPLAGTLTETFPATSVQGLDAARVNLPGSYGVSNGSFKALLMKSRRNPPPLVFSVVVSPHSLPLRPALPPTHDARPSCLCIPGVALALPTTRTRRGRLATTQSTSSATARSAWCSRRSWWRRER